MKCARSGALVVASRIAPVVSVERAERKEERQVLAPFVKHCEGRAKAYEKGSWRMNGDDVRAEVWGAVAFLLKQGRT